MDGSIYFSLLPPSPSKIRENEQNKIPSNSTDPKVTKSVSNLLLFSLRDSDSIWRFLCRCFNSSGCYQNWFTWLYLLPCLFRDHLSWPNIEEECIFFIGPMWSCTFYMGGWTQTTHGLNDNIVAMIWCVANCHRPNQSHAKRWLGCIFKGKKENCHESLR